MNKIYLGCSCNPISGIFQTAFIARHIHDSYEKFLWAICLLTGWTSLSVLLDSASASICFVLWTNRNYWPVLSADITGIVNIPLDCVRVISWRLLRCIGYAALYEKTFLNSELDIHGRKPPRPIYKHSDSLAWRDWQIPLSVWVEIIFVRDGSWIKDRPSV